MEFAELHGWCMTPRQAIALQKALAHRVCTESRLPQNLRHVAGVDVSFRRGDSLFHAAVVVVDLADMACVEAVCAAIEIRFPYVPGLLSFRELPVVLEAFRKLRSTPDAVLVDGQGIAHPRRLGLASHLGLWLGLPTVGCAKSRLCGEHPPPGRGRGERVPLVLDGTVVGTVLTTRDGIRPLYVSPGHMTDVPGAAELVLACTGRYRLPEPIRRAHQCANEARQRARSDINSPFH
ncbi:MAG: deoxyribonuclease V [Syntrophotalea acetylenica]|jgi:deoxyribonuclease V|uniref:deoxyribonuclease V n=1 Tax=Syntrophotalea sp. TaxID=2812029 RepID=UPI003D14D06F|nr:deoxyribonuclease V [Syntrophotalea acetylenica]